MAGGAPHRGPAGGAGGAEQGGPRQGRRAGGGGSCRGGDSCWRGQAARSATSLPPGSREQERLQEPYTHMASILLFYTVTKHSASGICQGMSWQHLHQPCVAGQVYSLSLSLSLSLARASRHCRAPGTLGLAARSALPSPWRGGGDWGATLQLFCLV